MNDYAFILFHHKSRIMDSKRFLVIGKKDSDLKEGDINFPSVHGPFSM